MEGTGLDFTPILRTLSLLTQPDVLGLVLLGNLIGLVFGVLPGVSGGQAFVVILPLTFGWPPEVAILFLMGMLGATSFGGAMCAILTNIPGDTQNAATCFDGYPMTRRGEATRALGIAALSNVLGTTFGTIVLIALFPLMQRIVLAFGPPEFFWLAVTGLVMIALAAQGSFVKGLAAGGVGVLISLIGFSPVLGVSRFTGGRDYFWDGIQLIALFIGFFAIAQAIAFSIEGRGAAHRVHTFVGWRGLLTGAADVLRAPVALVRSAAIGTFGGMIPGIGATASAFISYAVAKQFSSRPQHFHHGNPEGIVAAETAVNAKEPGGMLPMLAFGIPGSIEAALVLAALIFHGAQPGPFLIRDRPTVVWAIVLSLWIANAFGTLIGVIAANWLARLSAIRIVYLGPLVVVLSLVGTYLWRGNLWDMWIAIIAGVFGYAFVRAGFPVVPLVIGFLLGDVAERTYFQSMQISNGQIAFLFERVPSQIILGVLVVLVIAIVWRSQRLRTLAPVAPTGAP